MNQAEFRRRCESLSSDELAAWQLRRLNALLAAILPGNRFYADRLAGLRLPLTSFAEWSAVPFTTKAELADAADEAGFAPNRTFPPERYVRLHRTSGTRGRPLVVLDTAEDWQAWVDTWQYVLDAAGVTAQDRAFFAFSFGPFVGFWSAYDACVARGTLVIPGGGLSTVARVELLRTSRATVLLCTPSYALHLAEVAGQHGIDAAALGVRRIIVAGEPGGSAPAVRGRIESAWNAQVIDHAGATEVGPWGYADAERRGLHVVETEFLAEFVPQGDASGVATRQPPPGAPCELVLTTLGRVGSPVLRYRTGDLVRPVPGSGANRFVLLEGGVLGRVDDMLIVRGVNVFPAALEDILRSFPEIDEFRLTARKSGAMDALSIEIEDRRNDPERVATELQLRLGLKVDVNSVPLGSLPRFEGKGRRFVDRRWEG